MVYADVVVGKRGSSEELTYAVPAKIIPYIGVGSLVAVPIRDKKVKAVVVNLRRRVDKDIRNKVREILSIDKKILPISDGRLKTVNHLAERYITNASDIVFRTISSVRSIEFGDGSRQGAVKYLQAVWVDRVKHYLDTVSRYREVLIIFPTNQHLEAFKESIPSSFSHEVVVLTRAKSFKKAEKSEKILFLGTVGSSFLPIKQGGLVIIDQPSHIGSRYSNRPYLKAEDIALARARHEGIDVLISQSIITPYQLLAVKRKEAELETVEPKKTDVVISSRVGSDSIFLPNVKETISSVLHKKGRVCLFVASKGWASGYYCRDCQELVKCDNCGRTIGADLQKLVCNFCGHNTTLPKTCPNCRKNDLVALGDGLDKVASAAKETFGDVAMQVVAGQTAKFGRNAQITIATEKILSFPDAEFDQVVVVSADRALTGGAIDDQWRFLLILKELAAMSSNLTVQTYLLESRVWESLTASGVKRYFEQELGERKKFNLPPYAKQIEIIGTAKDREILGKQADKIIEGLSSYSGVELSVSEYLKDRPRYVTVSVQIIFPLNMTNLRPKLSELLAPNWAVMPT